MIEIKNISKKFQGAQEIVALNNISLEIQDGDILGVVGESGAGKSTLIRCINLLERPDCGEILIDGNDIMKFSQREIEKERGQIGMIFQQFNLLDQRTVFKNIAFPLKYKGHSRKEISSKVQKLLEIVGIPDKADAYPSELSGGQKQRVAIARALTVDPKILLCDEATSALDPETTKSILRLLKSIRDELNITLVIVTHQKEVVKEICNKAVVICDGNIVERGSVLDIFTKPESKASKSFIGEISENEHVKQIISTFSKEQNSNAKLVKLTFFGNTTDDAYISDISIQFNIRAGILFGDINLIQGEPVGILLVRIEGDPENIVESFKYLEIQNVIVEEVA